MVAFELCYTAYARATRVSLSLLSQALLAALLAWMFLDEDISMKMISGGLIILFGIGITFIDKPLSISMFSKK